MGHLSPLGCHVFNLKFSRCWSQVLYEIQTPFQADFKTHYLRVFQRSSKWLEAITTLKGSKRIKTWFKTLLFQASKGSNRDQWIWPLTSNGKSGLLHLPTTLYMENIDSVLSWVSSFHKLTHTCFIQFDFQVLRTAGILLAIFWVITSWLILNEDCLLSSLKRQISAGLKETERQNGRFTKQAK